MTKDKSRFERQAHSRRDYLKYVGITGVTGLGLSTSVAARDTTEVVLTRDADGPVKTTKAPTEWYEHERAARAAAETLRERFSNDPRVNLVGITRGEGSIGGYSTKRIRVGVIGDTGLFVPNEVNGVPTTVERGVSMDWQSCYDDVYDPAIGGVRNSSIYGGGSVACAAYKGGQEYAMTARHVFVSSGNGCDSASAVGETMYQPDSGNRFGTIEDEIHKHDAAFAESDSGRDVSNEIVDETAEIQGWVTEDGVSTLASGTHDVPGRFASSCSATGSVDSYDNTFFCSGTPNITDLVELDGNYTQGGDSGGIWYWVDSDDDAWVVNLHSGVLVDNNSSGAAAYAIEEEGYTFGN